MIIFGVLAVLAAYGLFGMGRAGWRSWRSWRGEQAVLVAHERAQAARPPEVIKAEIVDAEEARRAREWRTSFDAYLADINARFDTLVAGMPCDDDAPFDAGYWPAAEAPEHGPDVAHVDLAALAEFEPAAVLARVEQENALPPVFSWHTQELPTVPIGRARVEAVVRVQTTDRRRLRRAARHAAAQHPAPTHLPTVQ